LGDFNKHDSQKKSNNLDISSNFLYMIIMTVFAIAIFNAHGFSYFYQVKR